MPVKEDSAHVAAILMRGTGVMLLLLLLLLLLLPLPLPLPLPLLLLVGLEQQGCRATDDQ